MKKVHAMKWIRALRSGKYKQGKPGYLKRLNRYCCLGVLCEIYPKLNLAGQSIGGLDNFAKIGLSSRLGYINQYINFARLNDGETRHPGIIPRYERFTFDEIADIIQIEYVEGL